MSTIHISIAKIFLDVIRARNFLIIIVFQVSAKATQLQSRLEQAACATLIFIVIIEVEAWLHELVHVFLVSALIFKATRVVARAKINAFIRLILIIVKHALKATLFLFFVVLSATQSARSLLDSVLQIISFEVHPLLIIFKLFSDEVVLLTEDH